MKLKYAGLLQKNKKERENNNNYPRMYRAKTLGGLDSPAKTKITGENYKSTSQFIKKYNNTGKDLPRRRQRFGSAEPPHLASRQSTYG